MAPPPNLETCLVYLNELKQNNTRVWFDQHRPAYQTAREAFVKFINGIIDEFRKSDHLEGLTANECIPRMYRDLRFSRDKTPYKTNLAAMIAPGGWRFIRLGYYVSIEPTDRSMVAGGWYNPSAEQLERFRQEIKRDATAFKEITHARSFVSIFGAIEGNRLKTAPKGYDRTEPDISLLQLKQITAVHSYSDQEVLAVDFSDHVVSACRRMRPFLDSLNGFLD